MRKLETSPSAFKAGERFNPYGFFRGMYIPDCLARTKALTLAEKSVWAYLCKRTGENGHCYPSFTRIASDLAISRSGAIKSVNSLVSKGFLEKRSPSAGQGNQKTNHYIFLWHPCFDEGLQVPSQQSEPRGFPSSSSDSHCEPSPVNRVDQAGLQNAPKENLKKNNKKTTTTTASGDDCQPSVASSCGGSSLSEIQSRYIDLKVRRTVVEGKVRTTPDRLKKSLIRSALTGDLDISDLEELESWATPAEKRAPISSPQSESVQRKKEILHAKNQKAALEVKKWWSTLSEDHPAKREERPLFCQESRWMHLQFTKYEKAEVACDA